MRQKFFLICSLLIVCLHADEGANPSKTAHGSCSSLSAEEKQFASQLTTEEDQEFFCQELSAAQRKKVMALTKPLSPDEALQSFRKSKAKDSKGVPVTPSKKPGSGGSCPVK